MADSSFSLLADTWASLERLDFRVATVGMFPEDYESIKDHPEVEETTGELPPGYLGVGKLKAYLWGAYLTVSDEINKGHLLVLPDLEFILSSEWGADIVTSVPLLTQVGKSYEGIVNPPKRNSHVVRMRTQQDIDEMVADLGSSPTPRQMDVWMDEMYPDGHTRRVPAKKG